MSKEYDCLAYSTNAMAVLDAIEQAMHKLDNKAFVNNAFCSIASFYEFDPRASDVALKVASAILEGDNVKLSAALAKASAEFYKWAMSVDWPWSYVMLRKGEAL